MSDLVIASRSSNLALRQAELLRNLLPMRSCIRSFSTMGDSILGVRLQDIGGKGLFTKEIDAAVIGGAAQMAVHSMKDMETDISEDLRIAAILPRGSYSDAFISVDYEDISDLPAGAIIGTSSLRRQAQILHGFPHLRVQTLRGNVETRLRKLHSGEYSAIILAVAGLERLGLGSEISSILPSDTMLPAVAQGALAVTCRVDDSKTAELLFSLNHEETAVCVMAERAFLRKLNGSCRTPIAALAELREGGFIYLRGLLASEDGKKLVQRSCVTEVALSISAAESLALEIKREFDG